MAFARLRFDRSTRACIQSSVVALSAFAAAGVAQAQAGIGEVRESAAFGLGTASGLDDVLSEDAGFGSAVVSLGDLDGNGFPDVAVGTPEDEQNGDDTGAVWIVLRDDSTNGVASFQKISHGTGGLVASVGALSRFGSALDVIDLDGDGELELLVGAEGLDTLWILFLGSDGRVTGEVELSAQTTSVPVLPGSRFGAAVAALGDVNGDSVPDLAVGAPEDNTAGSGRGAFWMVYLDAQGGVDSHRRITEGVNNFTGDLIRNDFFGSAIVSLGDVDQNGVVDLAVGAPHPGSILPRPGAVWVLFMKSQGTKVLSHQKIDTLEGGFGGLVLDRQEFGASVASLGDLDGNGMVDLAVGVPRDGDAFEDNLGSLWVLQLNPDGTVLAEQKVGEDDGNLGTPLGEDGFFASALHSPGDEDLDGRPDLYVGVPGDQGLIEVLQIEPTGTVAARERVAGYDLDTLDDGDRFGAQVVSLGDLDGDGHGDWLVSAPEDSDFHQGEGAVWVLFMAADGSVARTAKIHRTDLDPPPVANGWLAFGRGIEVLGDLSGDGTVEVAISGMDLQAQLERLFIASLDAEGRVVQSKAIGDGLWGVLTGLSHTGLAAIGDLDGNGVTELAVGEPGDNSGGLIDSGAVWVLFLDAAGDVLAQQKISNADGGLAGPLPEFGRFGSSLVAVGDLDGDQRSELAVGAAEGSLSTSGDVWVLFLNADGTVRSEARLQGTIEPHGSFGKGLAAPGDLDQDGVPDLLAGASGGLLGGSAWVLFLQADGFVKSFKTLEEDAFGLDLGLVEGDELGHGLAMVGDLNSDGVDDVLVGEPANGAGRLFLLSLARGLDADVSTVSASGPATQVMSVDAGPEHAGKLYWVIGTTAGTQPGLPVSGLNFPINLDPLVQYFLFSAVHANSQTLQNSFALLDVDGRSTTTFNLPPVTASAIGLTLHHAYVVYDPFPDAVLTSNAVEALIVP